MSVKVQKYIANLGKSVIYSTADVLSEKFTYVNDFKNENREVFNEVYHSVKDYRTTFARLKKAITNNKIVDAARVGFDSVMYSVTTGDFYAKQKETEVINKYGGDLMSGFDIDDEDFDFESKDDVSEGEMVIATAVKKNSKLQTAITTEAIVKTGKAQMDVSKENTMMLYVQNERLMNKLDGGIENILGVMKQNNEQNAKIQNQMNDNLNKFMTNVDNNIAKLTKQMDELLEMQRNMYKPVKPEEKKRQGYSDIVDGRGVINLKEYAANVRKNTVNTILEKVPGASMLFGDSGLSGSNMLAAAAADIPRDLTKTVINKILGKQFDEAAKNLNSTLENIIPDIISRLNSYSKKSDSGVLGFLGKIFGIKTGSAENVNPATYTKGAIPFDGMTKKSIIEVIPHYLRKMTSVMTGSQEEIFDFNTGKWITMKAAKAQYDTIVGQEKASIESLIKSHLQQGTGRSFDAMYESRSEAKKGAEAVSKLAERIKSSGSIHTIKESELSLEERAILRSLKEIWKKDVSKNERDWYHETLDHKHKRRYQGPSVVGFDKQLMSIRNSQNFSIKQLNEQGGIPLIIASEGLTQPGEDYHGKSYVNAVGDMNQRHIQEMPMAQVLTRARDEFGVTLYQYLRSMGTSLNYIKKHSTYLRALPTISSGVNNSNPTNLTDIISSMPDDPIYTKNEKDKKYGEEYYKQLKADAENRMRINHEKAVADARKKAEKKHKNIEFVSAAYNFNDNDSIGYHRLISDQSSNYDEEVINEMYKEEREKERKKWQNMEELFGKEKADKLKMADKNFDENAGLIKNMKQVNSVSEKLIVLGKWINHKTSTNAVDKVTNTLVKTDQWLKNLIYGESLKPEEQKQSLWELIKGHTKSLFDSFTKMVSDNWKKITESLHLKELWEEKIKPAITNITGETDSVGNITRQGLLSPFVSGFRKGMKSNSDAVKKMYEEEANKIKSTASKIFNNDDTPSPAPIIDTDQSSNNNQEQYKEFENAGAIRKIKNDIQYAVNTINKLQQKISSQKQYIKQLENYIIDTDDAINAELYYYNNGSNSDLSKYADLKDEQAAYQDELKTAKKELKKLEKKLRDTKKHYNKLVAKAKSYGLNDIVQIHTMAAGGVNRTGRPFLSVLSAGEYLNGSKIGQTGVYTIPKGGVVFNPAPASIRSKQAQNERNFARGLKFNADANDGLTDVSNDTPEDPTKQLKQIDMNKITDWRTLSSNEERAAFLGNLASRGLLGGMVGFLTGGPLLGAAVGSASALSKSTNDFANFLFGEAERDSNGDAIYDEHDNPKRKNNGLISKELQKAAPRMTKLGMAGLGAGLLTPLGPVAGLAIGATLGFAKDAEIFQGSLFGDGGILSDEKIDKLKKSWKSMGLGALAGIALLPAQPFGLIGSLLLGATAGYASTTDKFKDFMLGEEDANGERNGGVRGAITDNVLRPLKGFGQTLVDKLMDEIFGPEGDNGKRDTDEGLLGAIRANVIRPMTQGAQSVFKELTNTIADIKDFTVNTIRNLQFKAAGNDLFGELFGIGGKVGSGIIGMGANAIRTLTKPFRILGDEGIGGKLKARRIRRGRADDMTARERQQYRGILGMSERDEWSSSDDYLSTANLEQLQALSNVLDFERDKGNILSYRNKAYTNLGQSLRKEGMTSRQSKRIIKMLKSGREGDVQKLLRLPGFANLDPQRINKLLAEHSGKMSNAEKMFEEMNANGMTAQQYLFKKGINLNIQDPRKAKYLKLMTDREIDHVKAGLTDEDLAWDKEKEFWSGKESPLNKVTDTAQNIESILESIHYDLTVGDDYDKLSKERQAKYGSKRNYIEAVKKERTRRSMIAISSGEKYISGNNSNIGKISRKGIKIGDFISNDIYNDYAPFYTGNLKDTLSPDDKWHNLLDEKLNTIIDTACQLFDGLAMKELCKTEAVEADLANEKAKIMAKNPGLPEDEAMMEASKHTLKRNITIKYTEKQIYDFEMWYRIKQDGSTIIPSKNQSRSFDEAKHSFVSDYVQIYAPAAVEDSYMDAMGMIGNIIKFSIYLAPSKLPIPVRDFIRKHGIELVKLAGKEIRKLGFTTEMMFKEHAINDNSWFQQLNIYKFELEADKAFQKAVLDYQQYKDKLVHIVNTATSETYKKELDKLNDKYKWIVDYLDKLTEELNLGSSFSALDKDSVEKVHKLFVERYIELKKEGRIFGRGLIGSIKKIGSILGKKFYKLVDPIKNFHNVMFNENKGLDKEEAKAKLMERFIKRAQKHWDKAFETRTDAEGREYQEVIDRNVKRIIKEHFGDIPWSQLSDEQKEEVKSAYLDWFSNVEWEGVTGSIGKHILSKEKLAIEQAGDYVKSKVRYGAAKLGHTTVRGINALKETNERLKKKRVIEVAINRNDDRLDEIAQEKYGKSFGYCTEEEANIVCNMFYERYGKGKFGVVASIKMRDKIRNNVLAKNAARTLGTLKSGVKNATAGSIEKIKGAKDKLRENNEFIDMLFSRIDARELRKEKQLKKGKSDSKLAKIIKWLFIGGVAVPFIVGFFKQDLLPAIHEKIQPWLSAAKDKLFGKKNETTDEYEGGIISGIVNPIRKYFKSKFEKVHQWLHNEGEFAAPDKGISGFWNNLAKIGNHMFELWKTGIHEVYGSLLPKILQKIGRNALPALWEVLKGLGSFIVDGIKGRYEGLDKDVLGPGIESNDNLNIGLAKSTTTLNDTVSGNQIRLETPGYNGKVDLSPININSNVSAKTDDKGNTVVENSVTGVKATSVKDDGTFYDTGKKSNGYSIYKKNNSDVSYFKTANGYIPASDYLKVTDESLVNNRAYDYQNKLEAGNRLNADYTDSNFTSKNAKVRNSIFKTLFSLNNLRIYDPRLYEKAVAGLGKVHGGISTGFKAISNLPGGAILGYPGRAVNWLAENGAKLASNITYKPQEWLYGLINKASGNAFDEAGAKIMQNQATTYLSAAKEASENATKNVAKYSREAADIAASDSPFAPMKSFFNRNKIDKAKDAAEAAAKNLADEEKIYRPQLEAASQKLSGKVAKETAEETAEETAKNVAKNSVDDIATATGFAAKLKEALKFIKDKLAGLIAKVFKDPKVTNAVGKTASECSDDAAKAISNAVEKTVSSNVDEIAKYGSKMGAKALSKAIPFVMIVVDFLAGMDDCRNILGTVSPKPTLGERLIAGYINMMPSLFMSLGELVGVGTAGAGAAVTVIGIVLGIIGLIILNVETIKNFFIDTLLDIISKHPALKILFGSANLFIDFDKLKKDREEAKKAVQAYNTKNNTNLSISEYNRLIGNETIQQKIGGKIEDNWSAKFGYDVDTKKTLIRNTELLEDKGKSAKVRKKLATIFSSVWQFYGKKHFNHQDQYGENGEELKGKEKLNANKIKFNSTMSEVIKGLNNLLLAFKESTIEEVLGNCTNFTGPIDAKTHLVNVYNSGYKNPNSVFTVDDEHVDWPRIKAIAGVCAIVGEIFESTGKRNEAIGIVAKCMIPAYFKQDERDIIDVESKLAEDSDKYVADLSGIDGSNNPESIDTEGTDEYVATNANANDKLTPFTTKDPFDKLKAGFDKGFAWLTNGSLYTRIGEYFGNLIHTSITRITGGLKGIGEFFASLSTKNQETNKDIDKLKLLPTDSDYWKVTLDSKNPFVSSIFNFAELVARITKAPFALAASTLYGAIGALNTSTSGSTTGPAAEHVGPTANQAASAGATDTAGTIDNQNNQKSSLWDKIKQGAKNLWNKLTGKGKGRGKYGTGDSSDPYHIYQRAYSGSYRVNGDSEAQTIADSGCGPASAASVLRMYGRQGDMRNAVNYALGNNYKEVDGGTYPQYFNDYLSNYGIKTNSNASNEDVINSLAQGKPVILMGQDATNSGNTPYGSAYSHYVVARGLDADGNVIVEDSEDKTGSTRYSLEDTLANSSIKITTGRGNSDDSVASNYVNAVTGFTMTTISSAMNSMNKLNGSNGNNNSGSKGGSPGNSNAPGAGMPAAGDGTTNGTAGTLTVDTDVKTKCGYTAQQLKDAIDEIHPEGCSASQFPEPAINTENGYGINALFTVAVAIQENGWDGFVGVNTTGRNKGNYNVFNMQGEPNSSNGRWKDFNNLDEAFAWFGQLINGNTYYGGGATTPGAIGNIYCPPTAAENAGFAPWGEAVCKVAGLIEKHIKKTNNNTDDKKDNNATADKTGTGRGKLGRAVDRENTLRARNENMYGHTRSITGKTNVVNNGRKSARGKAYSSILTGRAKDTKLTNNKPATVPNAPSSDMSPSATMVVRAVREVIRAYEKAGIVGSGNQYSQSKTVKLDFGEGDSFSARPDCTGLIDAVLEYMGYDSKGMNSTSLVSCSNITGQDGSTNDWDFIDKPQQSDIQLGDIVVRNGHGEIAACVDNGTVYGWNYGSDNGMAKSLKAVNLMDQGTDPAVACVQAGSAFERKGYDRIIRYKGRGAKGKFGRGRFGKAVLKRYNGKFGRGPADEEVIKAADTTTPETTTTDTTTATQPQQTAFKPKNTPASLMSNLGKYTRGLMRGLFGDFYDALYGEEKKPQNNNGNNQTNNGNGADGINGTANDPGDADGRMKALWQLFTGSGFSDNLAAGVLGNIRGESNFDPHVVEGGSQGSITDNMGHGYGLIQWTGAASRAALYNWCKKNGCDPESLDGQGKWVVAQIKGINIEDEADSANSGMFNGQSGQGTMSYNWSLIQKQGTFQDFCSWDLQKCVELFLRCVERPADISGAASTRLKYAQEVLSKCTGGTGRAVIDKYTKYGRGKFGRGGVPGNYENTAFTAFENKQEDTTSNNRRGAPTSSNPLWDINGTPRDNQLSAAYPGMVSEETQDKLSTDTQDSIEESLEENAGDNTENTSSGNIDKKPSSLMANLGKYTRGLMRGIFGDFYDALYGEEAVEEDNTDPNNNGGSSGGGTGDASTVLGACQIVVKAYEKAGIVGNDGDYNQGGKTVTLDLDSNIGGSTNNNANQQDQNQNGQTQDQSSGTGRGKGRYGRGKTYNARPDCTGFCDAVIECMGYDSEGMNSASFNSCSGIRDSSGNISPNWQIIDSPSLSDVQPGDICITYKGGDHHGEICVGESGGKLYGYTYGWEGGMKNALNAVNLQLQGSSPLDACVQAGSTINGHGYYTRLIRFMGNGGSSNQQQQDQQKQQDQQQNGSTTTPAAGTGKYGRGKGTGRAKSSGKVTNKSIIHDNIVANSGRYNGTNNPNSVYSINGKSKTAFGRAAANHSNTSLRAMSSSYGRANGYDDTTFMDETTLGNGIFSAGSTGSYSSTSSGGNLSSENLTEVLKALTTIASNSEQMDAVVQLLNTIAANTEKTYVAANTANTASGRGSSSSDKHHEKINPAFNNGLSALRRSFDSDNSGQDVAKAVYQIARS